MNTTEILLAMSTDCRLHAVAVEVVLHAIKDDKTNIVVTNGYINADDDIHIICTNNDVYGDKCVGYPCYIGATGELNVFQKSIAIGDVKHAIVNKGQWKESDVIFRD